MARRLLAIGVLGTLAAGCASQTNTASLPKPTFAGPVIDKPAYVPTPTAVRAVAPPPQRAVAPPAPFRPADVPAAWIPKPNAERREWTWIVIHHSATPTGGVAAFDKAHKAKGWDGVGYDFVIGNGTDTADGQIEVTYRWQNQAQGAHALTPDERFNKHGIGICMVGNFDATRPSAKQLASLEKLVAYLADTYRIKQSDILGHKMTGKQTDCPGNLTDIGQIRADVAKLRRVTLAEDPPPVPGRELMQTASR